MKKQHALIALMGRIRRHRKIRARIVGTASRPRLSVHRSAKLMYAQLIDDASGQTLASAKGKDGRMVGKEIAEKARALGISDAVFDRGGYVFHGRVKAVADGAREEKLNF